MVISSTDADIACENNFELTYSLKTKARKQCHIASILIYCTPVHIYLYYNIPNGKHKIHTDTHKQFAHIGT